MITTAYKQTLLDLHEKASWGTTGGKYAGKTVLELLEKHPEIKTILDYGCGEGTLKDWISERGVTNRKWTLYDPGMQPYQDKPEGTFDLVITTDVLEHVEEMMLNSVLDDLRGYTKRFLYNEIACYFSNCFFPDGPYAGQDLHINLKIPDMWAKRLKHRDFSVTTYVPSLIEEYKIRALIIQERKDYE